MLGEREILCGKSVWPKKKYFLSVKLDCKMFFFERTKNKEPFKLILLD